ncbi:MAG: pyrroloquinoline quinone biosynthesis peptide chaperone PqqD [Oscillatoriaceae cyanobacterium Prado104]|jgi:pyrroloquinoline quinone biosynthesis protein D|nr:pyrroloquinoline quinone biosynthesis peptide chaperone PqqD [Oscillatoriaceae cyanobacterium Prado104]
MNNNSYPYLACGVRLFWDEVRQQHFLLFPEGAIKLNKTAWAILKLCDRQHTIDEIVAELSAQFANTNIESDVCQLIAKISQRGLINESDSTTF